MSASAAGIVEAAATAAEDALIKAPANAVGAVGNSIAETVSSSVTYVVGLPGQFVRNVFEGAKDVVLSTSEAAVKLPGGLAKKAANAAGEAIQSTSEVAVSAVKESPREATKKLQEVSLEYCVCGCLCFRGVGLNKAYPGREIVSHHVVCEWESSECRIGHSMTKEGTNGDESHSCVEYTMEEV